MGLCAAAKHDSAYQLNLSQLRVELFTIRRRSILEESETAYRSSVGEVAGIKVSQLIGGHLRLFED
jgi:hypothetical protein